MTTAPLGADDAPLLTTKLHPPRRRRTLVARPRLDAVARRTSHLALTLVSAPAGFGKTTLVADWFAADGDTAWLSLDPRDDEPTRFWTYVLAATDAAAPHLESEAAALLATPGVPLDVVVATLINDLETAAQELVLVLDDYHVITAPEIHASVGFLLEHLPPTVRLVIATRADPPLPLASLRAAGDLLEVRADDLRFTADEATAYLAEAMELEVTADDVGVLEARTEGWIAALQLAALSMQKRPDPSTFVAEFAGDDRFILDYLADEVLERQIPAVRDFLLDTSILSRLCGPLCAAVTGVVDARATLEELERSNLFLVALDDRRTWYRYHHLFGDVLRARLLDDHPDRVPVLHRRASDWYAEHGETDEAITHALAGGAFERAAELIELAAPAVQRARRETQLRSWLEALPADLYHDRPVLAMALVGARMATGDATALDPLLAIVDSWLERSDPSDPSDADDPDGPGARPVVADHAAYLRVPATAAVHRAGLALLAGDAPATIAHAERVLDLAGEEDLLQRGAAEALVALAHWSQGDLETARDRYTRSIAHFVAGEYLSDAMGCSIALADIEIAQGRLRHAQHTFEAGLRHAAVNPGLRGAADMHVGLCLLAIEHDDLDAAARHLRASADLGEHLGLPQHRYRWRVAAARLHRANGEPGPALDLLAEAEARYTTDFSPSVRPVGAMRARLAVDLGDVGAGIRWAETAGVNADDDLSYVREYEHLTLAHVLVAQGSADLVDRATRLLERLLTAAEDGRRRGSAIEILVELAAAHHAAGRRTEAEESLARAVTLAGEEGYVRTFLDAGPAAADLVAGLRGGPAGREGVAVPPGGASERSARARSVDPEELSDRELDVLRLLRSDLSGPDIARELHVSLNTLRTHTRHIYAKLGVTNRREAVTRAAARGL